jgi:hypothetical protein
LGVVIRVLDLLIYFEPGRLCTLQKDLIIAPLPTQKQLWEASDETAWNNEREIQSMPVTFGLATNGELVKLGRGLINCKDDVVFERLPVIQTPGKSSTVWEEWFTGMDGLAGLVMLAASLIS